MAMQGMQGAQGQQGTQPQMGGGAGISFAKFESYLKRLGGDQLKALTADPKYNQNAVYFSMINNEIMARLKTQQEKQMQAQGQQQGAVPTVKENVQQAAQQLTDDAVVSAASGGIMRAAYRLPEDTGIAQLPAQNIANMAGGGIVAFAGGGDMEDGEVEYDPSMDIRQGEEDVVALGGDDSSPAGRWWRSTGIGKAIEGSRSEGKSYVDAQAARAALISEYGPRAGIGGLFMSQSDEDRTNAQKIVQLANDPKTSPEQIIALYSELPASTPATSKPTSPVAATTAPQASTPPAAAPRGPAGAAPGAAPAGLATTAPGQAAMGAPRSTGVDMLNNLKLDLTEVRKQRALDEAEARKVADLAKQQASEETQAYEKYLAQRGVYGKGREERIAQREAELPKRREEAQGMALLQAGLAILSAPPGRGAMAAIGAGAQSGLKMYQGDIEKLQAASEKLQSARDSLEDARYSQQTADETERRRLKSMERRAEMDGAKAMQEIASRYGMTLSMAEAKAKFDISLEQAKLQTKIDEENIQQAGALQRTLINERGANTRAAMAATRAGGLDELARQRLEAEKKFADPSQRLLIKREFPNVKTFDDYLIALGIPTKAGAAANTSAFPGASIVGSRKD